MGVRMAGRDRPHCRRRCGGEPEVRTDVADRFVPVEPGRDWEAALDGLRPARQGDRPTTGKASPGLHCETPSRSLPAVHEGVQGFARHLRRRDLREAMDPAHRAIEALLQTCRGSESPALASNARRMRPLWGRCRGRFGARLADPVIRSGSTSPRVIRATTPASSPAPRCSLAGRSMPASSSIARPWPTSRRPPVRR